VPRRSDEAGFTIVEILVAIFIFSLVSTAMYQLMISANRGSSTVQNVVNVSEEARLGFNRMVRDTREADFLQSPTATSFEVQTDFDANGVIQTAPSDAAGSYESLVFTFNPGGTNGTITVSNGGNSEVLMRGVSRLSATQPVFGYTSSRLEYENVTSACGVSPSTSIDGVATWVELDQSSIGNKNCTLDSTELQMVDGVNFSFKVTIGKSATTYFDQAQLRNQR
jgi:prepilin-type N-terminal cleavage/methylation domain-containing protein